MTTLMSGADMPAGRVLPKVFADVPSAEEVRQAEDVARRARSRAGGLMFVTLLLAGALVAAIIFIVMTLNSTDKLVEAEKTALKEVARLEGVNKGLTADVGKAQAAVNSVRTQFAVFTPITMVEGDISARREEIRKLLEQAPKASSIRDPAGWSAYGGSTKWPAYQNTGDWKGYIDENLRRQLASLDGLTAKINKFIADGGSTVIVKPPACTPSTPGYPVC